MTVVELQSSKSNVGKTLKLAHMVCDLTGFSGRKIVTSRLDRTAEDIQGQYEQIYFDPVSKIKLRREEEAQDGFLPAEWSNHN